MYIIIFTPSSCLMLPSSSKLFFPSKSLFYFLVLCLHMCVCVPIKFNEDYLITWVGMSFTGPYAMSHVSGATPLWHLFLLPLLIVRSQGNVCRPCPTSRHTKQFTICTYRLIIYALLIFLDVCSLLDPFHSLLKEAIRTAQGSLELVSVSSGNEC